MPIFIALFALTVLASSAWAVGAPVRIDGGDTITSITDATVTSSAPVIISASNQNRAALNCTSSDLVRWGNSSITATKGQQIPVGGAVEIRNTGAIYMIAESDTATVSCTEESFSTTSSSSGVFSP